jgi:histone H2B
VQRANQKKEPSPNFYFTQQQQKRGAGLAGPLPRSPPPAAKQARAIEASTRAHAPQAISNPLTPTTRQLQKPNPLPDLLFSPSTSNLQQHLLASQQLTQRTSSYSTDTTNPHLFFLTSFPSFEMAPKAADKKPASKAPATASKAPQEKKDAGKKTAASGDKKKRSKTRKETYSSYIYKGEFQFQPQSRLIVPCFGNAFTDLHLQSSSRSTPTLVSPTVPCLS